MSSRSERLAATTSRVRRFVSLAARGLLSDVRSAIRGALRFNTVRQMTDAVRRAWVRYDPAWADRLLARLAGLPTALHPELLERHVKVRERLAGEPAVYVGELEARPALRGITLSDHPEQPDVEDWLCEVLALTGATADRVRVRPTVPSPGPRPRVGPLTAQIGLTHDEPLSQL